MDIEISNCACAAKTTMKWENTIILGTDPFSNRRQTILLLLGEKAGVREDVNLKLLERFYLCRKYANRLRKIFKKLFL